MRIVRAVLVFILFVAASARGETVQEVMVPVSDGVSLATTVYLPEKGDGRWPVVLERTPYPRGKGGGWTELNIAYVTQSVRGRFGSGGAFRPFADEGWGGEHQDGADTVQWILKQPWCNGKVGTYGGSAPGLTSALLGPATRSLSCQVIQEACGDFSRFLAYQGGVFSKALVEGWLAAGVQVPEYAAAWKAQPPSSPYWTQYSADAKAAQVNSPGLFVGGWWDIFASGTIELFLQRQFHGADGARGNQKLVMRPAAHGPWGSQALKFPPNFDEFRVTPYRKRFMQHWLCGMDDGIMREPAVHYYTIGDDTSFSGPGWAWRTADTWPPFPAKPTPYYFHADGSLSTTDPARKAEPFTFTFDPGNPVPTLGGQNLTITYGPYDQRPLHDRTDVVRFQTEALTAPLEITGHVVVSLSVSTDAPDTDFTAKLVDIYPPDDNREILMLDSIKRLKYRNGNAKPASPLTPKEVVAVELDLGHISWVLNTRHRLGVHISSSNSPRFEPNPNTGEEFATPDRPAHPARNSVHVDAAHSSSILLPIAPKS